MPREAFEAGDILMQKTGFPHAVLWVGSDPPIAHSHDSPNTSGVVRASAKYLDSCVVDVYRYRERPLAQRAAEFAIAPSRASRSAGAWRKTIKACTASSRRTSPRRWR